MHRQGPARAALAPVPPRPRARTRTLARRQRAAHDATLSALSHPNAIGQRRGGPVGLGFWRQLAHWGAYGGHRGSGIHRVARGRPTSISPLRDRERALPTNSRAVRTGQHDRLRPTARQRPQHADRKPCLSITDDGAGGRDRPGVANGCSWRPLRTWSSASRSSSRATRRRMSSPALPRALRPGSSSPSRRASRPRAAPIRSSRSPATAT